jgi:hypothetical protein
MRQAFPDNPVILDKRDDPHLTMAFGAQQRVDLIDFLDQSVLSFPKCRGRYARFDQRRHLIIRAHLFRCWVRWSGRNKRYKIFMIHEHSSYFSYLMGL